MGFEPTSENSAWKLVFKKTSQVGAILLLVLGLAATTFVSYRHLRVLRRLPKIQFAPRQLEAPLSPDELARPGARWVEVKTTPTANPSKPGVNYRNTVESPGTLILQLRDNAVVKDDSAARGPQSYRGILYTLDRSRPGAAPASLISNLDQSGISPSARFAVLQVDQSPWLIWKPIVKETLALASGMLIVILLLIQGGQTVLALLRTPAGSDVGRLDEQRRATSIGRAARVLVAAIAISAIAWGLYESLRTRPVLPVGTIFGFGISAGLILARSVQRHVVSRRPKTVEAY